MRRRRSAGHRADARVLAPARRREHRLGRRALLLAGIVVALLVVSAALAPGPAGRRYPPSSASRCSRRGGASRRRDVRSAAPTVALVSLVPLGVAAAPSCCSADPRAAAAARSRQRGPPRAQAGTAASVVRAPAPGGVILALGGATVLAAAVADRSAAALLRSTADATADTAGLALPTRGTAAPPYRRRRPFADVEAGAFVTPNRTCYRIEHCPHGPAGSTSPPGSRRSAGRSTTARATALADLLAMPQVEEDIAIACVSNPVGGELVGNARSQGVLRQRPGRRRGAPGRRAVRRLSSTVSPPASHCRSGRRHAALIALAMNGEPLPAGTASRPG